MASRELWRWGDTVLPWGSPLYCSLSHSNFVPWLITPGSPGGSVGRNYLPSRRHRFDPWDRKIPWKAMAAHSSILAWKIPWSEEPGGQQSTGSQRAGLDWATNTHIQSLRSALLSSVTPTTAGPLPAASVPGNKTWEAGKRSASFLLVVPRVLISRFSICIPTYMYIHTHLTSCLGSLSLRTESSLVQFSPFKDGETEAQGGVGGLP